MAERPRSRATRPPLVLVSASPRRRWLLANAGVAFEVFAVDIDERPRPGEPAEPYARRMADEKAAAALAARGGAWLLAADTVVALDEEPYGKPRDGAEAASMLGRLAGREHVVYTAVSIFGPERTRAGGGVIATRVWFRALSADEVARYVATGEPLDRAGSYAIQGEGAHLIDRIEGSYTNVIGLPVPEVLTWLRSCGAL
jgi:septum formation protein